MCCALKDDSFIVKKISLVPSTTARFPDQPLEQRIKELKGMGSIVDFIQDEVSLDRIIITLQHIISIIRDWLGGLPTLATASRTTEKSTIRSLVTSSPFNKKCSLVERIHPTPS